MTLEPRTATRGAGWRAEVYATFQRSGGRGPRPAELAAYCQHEHRTEAKAARCAAWLQRRIQKPIAYPGPPA